MVEVVLIVVVILLQGHSQRSCQGTENYSRYESWIKFRPFTVSIQCKMKEESMAEYVEINKDRIKKEKKKYIYI